MGDIFSYIVTFVGLLGFWLAGRKVWWAWYVNIINQFAWVAFALITEYYAFLIGTMFYMFVFTRNAVLWTKNRNTETKNTSQVAQDAYLEGLRSGRDERPMTCGLSAQQHCGHSYLYDPGQ